MPDKSIHILPAGCYILGFGPNLWPNKRERTHAAKLPLQTVPYPKGNDRYLILPRYVDSFDDIFGGCNSHMYGVGRAWEISVRGEAIGFNRRRVYANLTGKSRLELFYGLLNFLRATVLRLGWGTVLGRHCCPPALETQPVRVCCGTDTDQTGDYG